MRLTILFLLSFCALSNTFATTVVFVSISGDETFPKVEDFNNVNAKIGQLVTDFKLERVVFNENYEGGYSACLIPHFTIKASEILQEMSSVKVDKNHTRYAVSISEVSKPLDLCGHIK